MDNNGLNTFEFHAEDDRATLNALRVERSTTSTFAMANTVKMSSLDSETAARQHLQLALASASMPRLTTATVNGAQSEFKTLSTEAIPFTDTKMVKFRQTYNKIPVYGSLVTVELDNQNELMAIRSGLGNPSNVDSIAKIAPAQALTTIRQLAGYGARPLDAIPRLCYYFDTRTSRWRLIYLVEDVRKMSNADAATADFPRRKGTHDEFSFRATAFVMDYLIDAHTGELVAELPRTPSMTPSITPGPFEIEAEDGLGKNRTLHCHRDDEGNMTLRDTRFNVHTHNFNFQDIDTGVLPGTHVVNPPMPWESGAISAHVNAVAVSKFLRQVLRRNNIDNMGSPMISSVNCIVRDESPDGKEWHNAAWVGTQMVYGQRRDDNNKLRSYAVGLDVVGHEIFHGVTDRTARLQYAAESGALNESYSDIFGVIISNLDTKNITDWSWEMGEELDGTGIPIRDMSNPTRFEQPDHMQNYQNLPVTQFGDWGGVHINSGIHNKAAFNIMTATGTDGNPLFTMEQLAILFYLALTQYLSRTSRFSDSRRAVVLVARTLFRNDASQQAKIAAINAGFNAAGIG